MANVKFNLEAEEAKAVQAFLRVVDAQKKAEGQFRRTTDEGKKQNLSFDKGVMSLAKWAGGFVTATAAIGAATKALQFHNAEIDKASARTRQSEAGLGQLSQLAGGDVATMKRMVEEAKKTSTTGGIGLDAAAKLQFNLESFGIADQRELFASLIGTVDDPSAAAEAAVTLRQAFGEKETGSVRAILNKGLAASSTSKTNLNALLSNSAQIAPGVAAVGGTDEEALSSLAILSKARRSPEMAATEINALTKVLMRQGMDKDGLFAGLDQIEKATANMSGQDKLKFFGDVEGFKAFSTLQQSRTELMGAYDMTQKGNVEGDQDQVAGAIRVRKAIPEIASAEQLRIAEQATAQEGADRFGVTGNLRLKALQDIERESLERGEGSTTRFARLSLAKGAKFLGEDEQGIREASSFEGTIGDQVIDKTLNFNVIDIFKLLIDAVKENTEATKKTSPAPGMSRNNGVVE